MPDPNAGLPPRYLRAPEAARFLSLSGRLSASQTFSWRSWSGLTVKAMSWSSVAAFDDGVIEEVRVDWLGEARIVQLEAQIVAVLVQALRPGGAYLGAADEDPERDRLLVVLDGGSVRRDITVVDDHEFRLVCLFRERSRAQRLWEPARVRQQFLRRFHHVGLLEPGDAVGVLVALRLSHRGEDLRLDHLPLRSASTHRGDPEAAIVRRLDRLTRAIERLECDLTISTEALALFVNFWLTTTPPLPDTMREAAQAKATPLD